ncbi:NAD(P)H-dependent oxidoreductase [Pseudoalteromonas tunicata]|uniref:NAD(P)H-dependent oxidoreductase n=1 Tax=Pseudoalteromonas tunicata TaxID=314281 RepID=UPI00273E6F9F|nr:NAD(P)H-dependent oxidoreductase [Pseudoalteromonas tunicata]MDP4984618.1 NAD(P)H-dependent oxidoreductase [Pseudoalteromonas tunicata]MDP5213416.1 NAD(P)H-dependent oxidoreductase [Pseudoalteromonas tunicata]
MSLLTALNWRYAVKEFAQKSLSEQNIQHLIEAVRLAPAAYGIQPYKLIVISSEKIKQACLVHSYGQDKVMNCSHLLVLASKTAITDKDITQFITALAVTLNTKSKSLAGYQHNIQSDLLNRSESERSSWATEQTYIALGTLLTSAAILNIDCCPITGFDAQGINHVLDLKAQNLCATVLIPIGYRALTDKAASKPKHRLKIDELVIAL